MGARSDRVDAAKIAELKLLYERGWLGQYCTSVLSRAGGIPLSVIPNSKDRPVGARTKRRKEARRAQAAWNAQRNTPPYPIPGGCDVMLSGPIEACPADTPIEAPAAMRPDSPAAPRLAPLTDSRPRWKDEITEVPPHPPPPPPRHQPDPTSLRGRVELLLANWERERTADIAAADDPTLPQEIRDAARRAADVGGIYIDELDRMYHEYVRDIA